MTPLTQTTSHSQHPVVSLRSILLPVFRGVCGVFLMSSAFCVWQELEAILFRRFLCFCFLFCWFVHNTATAPNTSSVFSFCWFLIFVLVVLVVLVLLSVLR